MSEKAVKRLNLKLIESNIKVKSANNITQKVLGITEKLEVNVQGTVCELAFVFIPHDDHDILLGVDWFAETNAGLKPGQNILQLKGKKIHLNELTEINDEVYLEDSI